MKKISAILMIALFVFNLFGYRLLFNYVQQQSDLQLQASLDKQEYSDDELLTIIVPTNLPYQIDRNTFERVDGEITVDGKIYKYVKRKVVNGQFVLLCLPDHNKMRLQSAKDDFFKAANDLVQNNQSKKTGHSKAEVSKNVFSDYIVSQNDFHLQDVCYQSITAACGVNNYFPTAPHQSPGQPPDVAA